MALKDQKSYTGELAFLSYCFTGVYFSYGLVAC